MDRILGVALLRPDGSVVTLPAPNRHHHIVHMLSDRGEDNHGEQGFYTLQLPFIGRVGALYLAADNGQLKPRKPGQYNGRELFSEDLW